MENLENAKAYLTSAIRYDNQNRLFDAFENYTQAFLLFETVYNTRIKSKKRPDQMSEVKIYMDNTYNRAEKIGLDLAQQGLIQSIVEDSETDISDESLALQRALSTAIVRRSDLNGGFEKITGLYQTKKILREATVLPLRRPEIFKDGNIKPWKTILLYGPPGSGKSFIARALAVESSYQFLSVSASDLVSKWQGESERLVKELFVLARQIAPCIIFLDEIDSLAVQRRDSDSESDRRVKNELLVQMQELINGPAQVIVIAATNFPEQLDNAMLRRFDRRIYIPLPGALARREMFEKAFKHLFPEQTKDQDQQKSNLQKLVDSSEYYSASDIDLVTKEAYYRPLREAELSRRFLKSTNEQGVDTYQAVDTSHKHVGEIHTTLYDLPKKAILVLRDVKFEDVMQALTTSKSSVSQQTLINFKNFTVLYGMDGS